MKLLTRVIAVLLFPGFSLAADFNAVSNSERHPVSAFQQLNRISDDGESGVNLNELEAGPVEVANPYYVPCIRKIAEALSEAPAGALNACRNIDNRYSFAVVSFLIGKFSEVPMNFFRESSRVRNSYSRDAVLALLDRYREIPFRVFRAATQADLPAESECVVALVSGRLEVTARIMRSVCLQ